MRRTAQPPSPPATEPAVIARISERFARADPRLLVGLGDDAAVLRTGDVSDTARRLNASNLVVTTDLLVEGVHFDLRYLSMADAGYKALMVNLSDIAAMGARPTYAFGNLGLPPAATLAAVDELLDGVAAAADAAGVVLAGGDTVAAPQWLAGFTVLGEAVGPVLTRGGARAGDLVWHSGGLGLSQVGLAQLWSGQPAPDPAVVDACQVHRRPRAQLELGQFLQASGLASAGLDLSDSLAQCLLQLAAASHVGLLLDFHNYPFSPAVQAFRRRRRSWRGGGSAAFSVPARFDPAGRPCRFQSLAEFVLAAAEDYQLLFTAPPAASARLLTGSPLPLTRLGTVVDATEGCHYRAEDGRTHELQRLGFEHR